MLHSQALEADQLRHMRAHLLARPCNPAEALSLRPLTPVIVQGNLAGHAVLRRPASQTTKGGIFRTGRGARATLNAVTLFQYEGALSGGPNPQTWSLFNNAIV